MIDSVRAAHEMSDALAGPWFPPAGIFSGLRDSRPDVDVDSFLTPLGLELVDAAPRMRYAEFVVVPGDHLATLMQAQPQAAAFVVSAFD